MIRNCTWSKVNTVSLVVREAPGLIPGCNIQHPFNIMPRLETACVLERSNGHTGFIDKDKCTGCNSLNGSASSPRIGSSWVRTMAESYQKPLSW